MTIIKKQFELLTVALYLAQSPKYAEAENFLRSTTVEPKIII